MYLLLLHLIETNTQHIVVLTTNQPFVRQLRNENTKN